MKNSSLRRQHKVGKEESMDKLSLEKFEEASEVVKEVTKETKLMFSEYFSAQSGNRIYLKPENMQQTGAYKVRGAYYKISTLTPEQKSHGIITASAGNHECGNEKRKRSADSLYSRLCKGC